MKLHISPANGYGRFSLTWPEGLRVPAVDEVLVINGRDGECRVAQVRWEKQHGAHWDIQLVVVVQ